MQQAKISIEETQAEFLSNCRAYGYKDKSSLVREAINRLKHELEQASLKESAMAYAELFENDSELAELTESALDGWPE
jgi:metal-responsive CopG/Arc/MetJ family transcriptional regulator